MILFPTIIPGSVWSHPIWEWSLYNETCTKKKRQALCFNCWKLGVLTSHIVWEILTGGFSKQKPETVYLTKFNWIEMTSFGFFTFVLRNKSNEFMFP